VHVDPANLLPHVPLLLKPAWRATGGDKLGIVVEYSLNPAFSTQPITLSNLVLIVSYEGAKAISAQTKPSGTHVKDKSLVFWRLGDVTLDPSQPAQKVIGRLLGDQGGQPTPGVVEAKWEVVVPRGWGLGSGLGVSRKVVEGKGKEREVDPFADEDAKAGEEWVEVESVRKIGSGKYDALTVGEETM